jgi:4-hydroxy-tetrahydrodipicolinate synthase
MKGREEIRTALTGPVTSVYMPFCRDGSIDFAGLRNQIDFSVDAGSSAMILTAGDSRYSILSDEEIAQVTRVTVEHTAGRALVVAADKSWGTLQEIEFAQYARDVGADVLMVRPPELASCSTETYVAHYAAAAEHIPVMVVNNVFRDSPMGQSMEVLKALRDRVEGIVAVKDDVCGPFARRMCLLVHERWAVIAGGQKQNHLNILPYGCDGYFSTFSNFRPSVAHDYWVAVQAGDLVRMREIIRTYDIPFFDFTLNQPPVPWVSWMYGTLELFGVCQRWNRPPCYTLNSEEMERLADFFKSKSLL